MPFGCGASPSLKCPEYTMDRTMNDQTHAASSQQPATARRRVMMLSALLLITAVAVFGVTAILITIFEHKQEARVPFVRVHEVTEVSTNPVPWGLNWPHQYDGYRATAGDTSYGGSSAMPESKLE